ncbi:MAG: hypothetical protein ABIJ91_04915 [Candidatus Kuenenbacteria bacterium]
MTDDLGKNNKNLLTKLMFGVLCFFGVSALILGILQINRAINITGNYTLGTDEVNLNDFSAGLDQQQRTIEELQATDTDGDGLSDFDELYVYKTSMYLKDSDSDGYEDKAEIDGGYDPNCPKGQDCRQPSTDTQYYNGDYGLDNAGQAIGDQLPADQLPDTQPSGELPDELKNLSPDQVRELLLSTGQISAEDLSQIDDETLMGIYKDTLNQ